MKTWPLAVALLGYAVFAQQPAPVQNSTEPKSFPGYTSDARMKFPAHYREWIYLTSGIDMSYSPMSMAGHSVFDNVFVNPEAYLSFLESGTWPDKTVLVLEIRGAESKGSINRNGHYQGTEVMGIEVHVKDETRFPGKWAFFNFEDQISGKLVPAGAACYTCHAQHAAVDTTFVQFYPTLLEIARKRGTLSPAYMRESADK